MSIFKNLLVIGTLSLIFSAQSFGYTYVDSATWNANDAMSVLQTQGIKMNALERALDKCRQAGDILCVFKNSEIIKHNNRQWSSRHNSYRRYTQVEVVVQSIDELDLQRAGTFTATDSWNFSTSAETLLSLGVKAEALENAISKCEKAGNHFCVVLSVSFVRNNERFYDSEYSQYRYKTEARATVKGYKVW